MVPYKRLITVSYFVNMTELKVTWPWTRDVIIPDSSMGQMAKKPRRNAFQNMAPLYYTCMEKLINGLFCCEIM